MNPSFTILYLLSFFFFNNYLIRAIIMAHFIYELETGDKIIQHGHIYQTPRTQARLLRV